LVKDSVRHPAHALANAGRAFHDARIGVEPAMQKPRTVSKEAAMTMASAMGYF
jgi:hypothetical protein